MIVAASIALVAISTAAVELPRAPCEAQDEVHVALEEAEAEGTAALDARLSALERLLDFPLMRGVDAKQAHRVDVALARLSSLCAPHAAAPVVRAPPVDAARLQEVLSRPEFENARNRKGDAFAALIRRVIEWFESLLQTREMETGAKWMRFVVLALAAGLALFGFLRLRGVRFGSRRRATAALAGAGPLVLDDPSQHLARAREALSGDSRTAIREGLLALLSTLERQRWARPDRVKTNRELARELPGRGAPEAITSEVESLVGWYDRTFYSLAPVPSEEARHFVDQIASFEGRIASGASR